MAKGMFSAAPVGAVTLVETPVSQWYVKMARLAFICVGLGCGVAVSAVASAFVALWMALGFGVGAGLVLGFVSALVVRAWPVLRVLWWWSLEIAVASLLLAGVSLLARVWPWWLALAAVMVLVAGVLLVGPVRRFVFAWSWCVVDRHRLRLCFAQLVRGSGQGGSRPLQVPLMLWARPTLAGERVWVWLRPGLALEDLDGKTTRIAVACFGASLVRVSRARQNLSALVRVDVTRRDPLTGMVPSPLSALLGGSDTYDELADVPVSPAVPLVGLDLADVPEQPAPEPPRGGGRR
ncbi:hypothetical protein [Actinoplanes derwentensis]|uniref:Uncharacterized protein n=1 Tax=Actinoplanes derwentensis TaxID=113562 RepID=A0A1H1ZXK1_9ACTN|nr:hypothetical protein [Actinoplanes derwentensis]GID83511.1 hypothetical protein Ade03nite_24350 [Actinoplanes derwentensis]SDT37966.1 hypothetical protein SAMN04489716_3531 [Actinoplanes derwentensis]